ncbi:MAG: CreA family protein, partial [Mesorhizobium sp.]
IWKKQVVNRIYDKANDTLIYLSHSRQVQDGSAKMALTSVPLYGQQVTWTKGKPQ